MSKDFEELVAIELAKLGWIIKNGMARKGDQPTAPDKYNPVFKRDCHLAKDIVQTRLKAGIKS